MLTVFLWIYGSFIFIDIVRWLYVWDDPYKPGVFEWLLKSIIGNAVWAFIFTIFIKIGIWLFS